MKILFNKVVINKWITSLCVFFLLICTNALAENINNIVIGAYYFYKGTLSDDRVKVLDIDSSSNRVQIYNPDSKEVDWINASDLITRSESNDRDAARVGVGILAALAVAVASDSNKNYIICFKNSTKYSIGYKIRWGNGAWENAKERLKPGNIRREWNKSNIEFRLSFDETPSSQSISWKTYLLDTTATTSTDSCNGIHTYEFKQNYGLVDFYQ